MGDHEKVLFVQERESGYNAVIAVHNTTLGPGVGGTRIWHYETIEDAAADALRLSRAMTFKSAIHHLPFGGGKAVIMHPRGSFDRAQLFRRHGAAIDLLRGAYVTAEDVGTSPEDMETIAQETQYVVGGGDVSVSPATARGLYRSMEAVAEVLWGNGLAGKSVLVQGCGHVGATLANRLLQAGARVLISDIDETRTAALRETGAYERVDVDECVSANVDILAPCALGAVFTRENVGNVKARAIVGAANNQLASDDVAEMLHARGVTYVPDYLANGGGIIKVAQLHEGWSEKEGAARIDGIYDTTHEVLDCAARLAVTPLAAANEVVTARLNRQEVELTTWR